MRISLSLRGQEKPLPHRQPNSHRKPNRQSDTFKGGRDIYHCGRKVFHNLEHILECQIRLGSTGEKSGSS